MYENYCVDERGEGCIQPPPTAFTWGGTSKIVYCYVRHRIESSPDERHKEPRSTGNIQFPIALNETPCFDRTADDTFRSNTAQSPY
jgi:hypothetical protein